MNNTVDPEKMVMDNSNLWNHTTDAISGDVSASPGVIILMDVAELKP